MSDSDDKSKALSLENESVHRVYDIIASHFSGTRYKVLPKRTFSIITLAMAICRDVSERFTSWIRGS